ncbi:TetR/AcrR family transcriptional regulator [Actinopolymorpha alba]|uniref:TetR/AcrR family transcriptional regulator n=1 Tax=Actinopolymorpha alba TaxID=533267 RepID=UPI0012F65690|nr:TetR/AcrR family transcriptional regulator [Actinopolymorpha alba]
MTARESARERGERNGRARPVAGVDTRTRIQEVALELFTQQGYEKTSLREIADRLGVTKAALYYHFKSKEEIVSSTVEDFLTDIDELVAWATEQPRTTETRHELLRRYSDLVDRRFPAMRFFQQNPTGTHKTQLGEEFKERMQAMHGLLYDDGPPAQRIRALLAIVGMHMGTVIFENDDYGTPEELKQATLDVAFELVDRA